MSRRQSAPLTFIPSSAPSSAGPSVSLSSTSNSFGLHDTLRQGGHRSLASEIQVDTYEQRLKNVRIYGDAKREGAG